MRRSIYFITHPDVVISCDVPVTQWPLSARGVARMRQGLRRPWVAEITSIYCSAERKAIDAARILAVHLTLGVEQVVELGENDRSATGFLPAPEFEKTAGRFFADPDAAIDGWERAVDAQSRVLTAVTSIAARDATSGAIAIVSHGAVGTLLYCKIAGQPISRRWDQPPNGGGNYFRFTLAPSAAHSWWQAFDEAV